MREWSSNKETLLIKILFTHKNFNKKMINLKAKGIIKINPIKTTFNKHKINGKRLQKSINHKLFTILSKMMKNLNKGIKFIWLIKKTRKELPNKKQNRIKL